MTEKRFTRAFTGDEWLRSHFLDNGMPLSRGEVLDLLNALHEENQTLRAFIKRLTNNCGEIILMNGVGYKVDKILEDLE